MSNGGSTPKQYAIPDGAKEIQDLIEYRKMNFAMGNIFKAAYREKESLDPLYDINKILWFAEREKKRLEKSLIPPVPCAPQPGPFTPIQPGPVPDVRPCGEMYFNIASSTCVHTGNDGGSCHPEICPL